jgi:hypothetical protein
MDKTESRQHRCKDSWLPRCQSPSMGNGPDIRNTHRAASILSRRPVSVAARVESRDRHPRRRGKGHSILGWRTAGVMAKVEARQHRRKDFWLRRCRFPSTASEGTGPTSETAIADASILSRGSASVADRVESRGRRHRRRGRGHSVLGWRTASPRDGPDIRNRHRGCFCPLTAFGQSCPTASGVSPSARRTAKTEARDRHDRRRGKGHSFLGWRTAGVMTKVEARERRRRREDSKEFIVFQMAVPFAMARGCRGNGPDIRNRHRVASILAPAPWLPCLRASSRRLPRGERRAWGRRERRGGGRTKATRRRGGGDRC